MTTNMKPAFRSPGARFAAGALSIPWAKPPGTTAERLQSIVAMGQRIEGYVQFICKIGDLSGTSAEAKDKTVAVFYEQMLLLERQLGRIQEDLQLG